MPCVIGFCPLGREGPLGWPVYIACHGEAASPGAGRAVHPNTPRGGVADWWTCKASFSNRLSPFFFPPLGCLGSSPVNQVGQVPSRIRGAPDPSTDAPWMHRSQARPAPVRDRRAPQLLLAAPAQPAELTAGRQRVRAALRSKDTDIASLAEAHPSSPEWAHTWRAARSAALDRPSAARQALRWSLQQAHPQVHARVTHLCQLATLSHVMLSCPVFQAVWEWFGDVWTAVTQQPAPPLHADLRC